MLRREHRRTPNISSSTQDENRLARFDSRSGKELVAGHRHQRQRRRLNQVEPLGNLRQHRRLHHTQFRVRIVRHGKYPVADGKAFHSRPQLHHGSGDIDSDEARELERIKILRQPGTSFVVDRIHACGRDPHQHLARTGDRVRILLELQHLRTAILVDNDSLHISSPRTTP